MLQFPLRDAQIEIPFESCLTSVKERNPNGEVNERTNNLAWIGERAGAELSKAEFERTEGLFMAIGINFWRSFNGGWPVHSLSLSLSLSLYRVLIEHSGITGGTDYQRKSS